MKGLVKIGLIGALSLTIAPSVNAQKKKGKMEMKTQIDTVSYSLGVNIAKNLKSQGMTDMNIDVLAGAMRDVMADTDLKVNDADGQKILQEYMQTQQKKKEEEAAKEGTEFLAKNGKRKEVTTTASGLQYEVMTEGTGAKPSATSKVRVHYHGTLIDGTVFDSSVDRGESIAFGLNQVIKGWTEGVQLMTVGSKYKFFIPQDLAYGPRGQGAIPAYSALIFEVELIAIED